MTRFFALLLGLTLAAGCGSSSDPDRADLEEIYIDLALQGAPGSEPDEAALDSLRRRIDRLGGSARVESLMVRSMERDPDRWKEVLDSLAKTLP